MKTPILHTNEKSITKLGNLNASILKPIVNDPNSPYYSSDGQPVTSGDYRQRVLNMIKLPRRRSFHSLFVGTFLVVGTISSVYCSSILILYQKEEQLDGLIKEKKRLQRLLSDC
jgi:hypothetical protein